MYPLRGHPHRLTNRTELELILRPHLGIQRADSSIPALLG